MADQQNNIPSEEEIKEVAHSTRRPDEYVKGEAQELAQNIDKDSAVDAGVVANVAAAEKASEGALAKGWDAAVTGIQKGIESTGVLPETPHDALAHPHDDTVVIRGMAMPVYTAVFGALAVMTITEVLLAEIFGEGFIRILLLLGIAIAKAGLVVYYYMHLKDDSRVFALTLFVPVAITVLSMLFLLTVPAGY